MVILQLQQLRFRESWDHGELRHSISRVLLRWRNGNEPTFAIRPEDTVYSSIKTMFTSLVVSADDRVSGPAGENRLLNTYLRYHSFVRFGCP